MSKKSTQNLLTAHSQFFYFPFKHAPGNKKEVNNE